MKKLYIFSLILSVTVIFGALTHTALAADGITLTYQDQKFVIPNEAINSWRTFLKISPENSIKQRPLYADDLISKFIAKPVTKITQTETVHFNPTEIYNYIENISAEVNKSSVEPKLTIKDNKVTEFNEPQDGTELDKYQTTLDIITALENNKSEAVLNVSITKPTQSLSSLNNFGINELLARGESNFKGSPKNRRHNISVGVDKMKGILVPPGQEFSFNTNLGPVDGEHGFLPELVIKGNNTIPEFGGGLCQVSSTTFRAAMKAGVPITQRRNHAYAVQYYSPQGTDATIYPGVIDLKFINDTPGYILIWPYFKDKDNLVFDFFGTKDDREVTVEKPVQYDRQISGAMKATWQREVIKDGQTRTDVFKSTYQPAALFHHDTAFVTTPTENQQPIIQQPTPIN